MRKDEKYERQSESFNQYAESHGSENMEINNI